MKPFLLFLLTASVLWADPFAKVRNSNDKVVELVSQPTGWTAPTNKFGPGFAFRYVPVLQVSAPTNLDGMVFSLEPSRTVTLTNVVKGWVTNQLSPAALKRNINDAAATQADLLLSQKDTISVLLDAFWGYDSQLNGATFKTQSAIAAGRSNAITAALTLRSNLKQITDRRKELIDLVNTNVAGLTNIGGWPVFTP